MTLRYLNDEAPPTPGRRVCGDTKAKELQMRRPSSRVGLILLAAVVAVVALAATAALLYVPFAQRSLLLMGEGSSQQTENK